MAKSAATTPTPAPLDARAAESLAFADAALNLAGHQVTDPVLRDLLERAARNEISGDEARDAMRRHIQG